MNRSIDSTLMGSVFRQAGPAGEERPL